MKTILVNTVLFAAALLLPTLAFARTTSPAGASCCGPACCTTSCCATDAKSCGACCGDACVRDGVPVALRREVRWRNRATGRLPSEENARLKPPSSTKAGPDRVRPGAVPAAASSFSY